MLDTLAYIRFNTKVSVLQQIVDTDTGELLFELKSNVLLLNVKYFGIVLYQYIKRLREGRKNLQVIIRSYSNTPGTKEIDFFS